MRKAVLGSSSNQCSRFLFVCGGAGPRGTVGEGGAWTRTRSRPGLPCPPATLEDGVSMDVSDSVSTPWAHPAMVGTTVSGPRSDSRGFRHSPNVTQAPEVCLKIRVPSRDATFKGSRCGPANGPRGHCCHVGTELEFGACPLSPPVSREHSPSTSGWRFHKCHKNPPGCHKQSRKAGRS